MVSHAPLQLNSQPRWGLLVDLCSGELIDRSTTRNGYIFISVGISVALQRPTLGPPKTERSFFRTLRVWTYFPWQHPSLLDMSQKPVCDNQPARHPKSGGVSAQKSDVIPRNTCLRGVGFKWRTGSLRRISELIDSVWATSSTFSSDATRNPSCRNW